MKRINNIIYAIIILIALLSLSCSGQPRSKYRIANTDAQGNLVNVPSAVKYHFFLEKKGTTVHLVDNMDYATLPTGNMYEVGTASIPAYVVDVPNDGSEYLVGIVAENDAGYYGAMGVSTGTVGLVPAKPAMVKFEKI
jgi:hypothetical protein